jgi:hypothetical protein
MEKSRWQQLCAQASVEQDSTKLLQLATEINKLLEDERDQKLVRFNLMPANSFQESRKLKDAM